MNKINQVPLLLQRAEREWKAIYPELPVADAALIGQLIGAGANADRVGLENLKPYDLRQTEHDVLACAMRQGQPFKVTPSKLLKEVRITSGALTTCLNRLIDRDLIVRLAADKDQRSKPIQLTQKGFSVIESVTQQRFQLAGEVMAGFSKDEKLMLNKLLSKFQHNLLETVETGSQ
ncbi:hypothetical protein CEW91_05280 [Idiomarina piscisalsi]|uniref:HTH marR-type domain-containing protein n=1 Tax=Idiomarina piscisalsi TaxID=1096243 RepID=A0ABM6LSZ9_9GAMM|nr:MarR family transcriptional regulator [Idiomarina piscisalsi]ASG65582.1 hypothetical protein CEW91_05280 [Idiomarina piscisalsi]